MQNHVRVLIVRVRTLTENVRVLATKHRVAHHTRNSLWLVVLPIPPMLALLALWYFVLFQNDVHFEQKFETISAACGAVLMATAYLCLFGIVSAKALDKYDRCEDVVEAVDHEKYLELRYRHINPLTHVFLGLLSWLTMFTMLGFDYPSLLDGLIFIAVFGYLFGLLFFWLIQIDHPFIWLWAIDIPDCWKNIDEKALREERRAELERAFKEKYEKRKHLKSAA
jgi:hypothetical protein